tara:strand:+ start:28880 stop:29260 length:381 start_codon:yes stop_codon:yes gene_type:complete
MDNYLKVSIIGLVTGIVASFVGGGAEILIVPLLIYLNVLSDYKEAIATSLASLLLPIGIVAVYFYNKQNCTKKCIHWNYALTISLFFVLGTFASYYSSSLDNKYLKIIFAGLMILLGSLILYEEIH